MTGRQEATVNSIAARTEILAIVALFENRLLTEEAAEEELATIERYIHYARLEMICCEGGGEIEGPFYEVGTGS